MNGYLCRLRCVYCGAEFPVVSMTSGCPACRSDDFASSLSPTYDYDQLAADLGTRSLATTGRGIWRYRDLLPVEDPVHEVSLGEGDTPLLPMPSLAPGLGAGQVWVKDESRNPTWTFKDRNAAVTVSKAVEFGAQTIVVSTSGNHGASVAAYAARAGLECIVLTYPGIPAGTRTMIEAAGARLVVTEPDRRWLLMAEGMREHGWYPASNYTDIPTNGAFGHEGYKSIAYEIVADLGRVPDVVSVPTAYGEGLFGIWKGFDELVRLGRADRVPRMVACEPLGGPLVLSMEDPDRLVSKVERASTVARGIGGSVNSYISVAALQASNGLVAQPDDGSIMTAQRDLAARGMFVEPASAAGLAGLRRLTEEGLLPPASDVVLVNTSSGLKNVDAIRAHLDDELAASS